jgi:hypothetical protein
MPSKLTNNESGLCQGNWLAKHGINFRAHDSCDVRFRLLRVDLDEPTWPLTHELSITLLDPTAKHDGLPLESVGWRPTSVFVEQRQLRRNPIADILGRERK